MCVFFSDVRAFSLQLPPLDYLFSLIVYLWHRGIIMTENLIKNAMHAIETMDHSREATLCRLQRAGILTKTGRMTAFYRRCIQAQTPKG